MESLLDIAKKLAADAGLTMIHQRDGWELLSPRNGVVLVHSGFGSLREIVTYLTPAPEDRTVRFTDTEHWHEVKES
jgi:hypothetical protein